MRPRSPPDRPQRQISGHAKRRSGASSFHAFSWQCAIYCRRTRPHDMGTRLKAKSPGITLGVPWGSPGGPPGGPPGGLPRGPPQWTPPWGHAQDTQGTPRSVVWGAVRGFHPPELRIRLGFFSAMPVPIPGSKVRSDSLKVKFLMIFGRPKTGFFG